MESDIEHVPASIMRSWEPRWGIAQPLRPRPRARATTAAESADRIVATRLNASFQLNERVESRLQCSVVRDLAPEIRGKVGDP
jgi:hypothetical protein